MLINFAQSLTRFAEPHSEAEVHPHAQSERANLYSAPSGGAAEFEVLNFLNALVYLYKPNLVLETGTGSGLGTAAIAHGLMTNRFGHVHSVELDNQVRVRAGQTIARMQAGMVDWVTLHQGDSREFICNWQGDPFDFVFFDSLVEFRHVEFQTMQQQGLLNKGAVCVFHDTSRARGETMSDFNRGMIDALDNESSGRQWMESEGSRGLRVIRL